MNTTCKLCEKVDAKWKSLWSKSWIETWQRMPLKYVEHSFYCKIFMNKWEKMDAKQYFIGFAKKRLTKLGRLFNE